jgi:hypothetical protein
VRCSAGRLGHSLLSLRAAHIMAEPRCSADVENGTEGREVMSEPPSLRPLVRCSVVFRKAEICRIAAKTWAVEVSLVEGRNAWRPDERVEFVDKTAKKRATRGDRVATRTRRDFPSVR